MEEANASSIFLPIFLRMQTRNLAPESGLTKALALFIHNSSIPLI